MLDHYPAVSHLRCRSCEKAYDLDELWEASGVDCDREEGWLKCECGEIVYFRLHLDEHENVKKFIDSMTTRFRKMYGEMTLIKPVIGSVSVYFENGQFNFTFHNIKGDSLSMKESKEDECVVCYENCKTKTMCGHQLCRECNKSLYKRECPYCKQPLPDDYLELCVDANNTCQEVYVC